MCGNGPLSDMGMYRRERPKACWALRFDISIGLLAVVSSRCAGIDGSTSGFLKLVRSSVNDSGEFETKSYQKGGGFDADKSRSGVPHRTA
jgi:hypothetical protein